MTPEEKARSLALDYTSRPRDTDRLPWKRDLYRETAAFMFGITEADVTEAQRELGKRAVIGHVYGFSPEDPEPRRPYSDRRNLPLSVRIRLWFTPSMVLVDRLPGGTVAQCVVAKILDGKIYVVKTFEDVYPN